MSHLSALPIALFKKKIGIPFHIVTLTHVTVSKFIVGLFLGLVFQLSQASSFVALQRENLCVTSAPAVSCCCDDLPSCPCAMESRESEKPAPLLPVGVELKLLLSKAPETPLLETLLSPLATSHALVATPALARCAYQGVPLSVAFCSFVI
jgi:hypothetical protein